MANWKVWVTKFSGADGSVLWNRKLLDEACPAAVVPGWRSGLFVEGGVIYADVAANPITPSTGVYVWGVATTGPAGSFFKSLRLGLDGSPDPDFGGVQILTKAALEAAAGQSPLGTPTAGFACGLPDGGFIGTGSLVSGTGYVKFMARYNAAGGLNTAWGTGGIAVVPPVVSGDDANFYWYDIPTGVRPRPDGSGAVGLGVPNALDPDTFDSTAYFCTFSAAGAFVSSVRGGADAALPTDYTTGAAAILSDGRFVALPEDLVPEYPFLAVYAAGGGIAVKATLPGAFFPTPRALCGLSDGGWLFAYYLGTTLTLSRYAAAGTVTWTSTKTLTQSSPSLDVAAGTDGKIVVAVLDKTSSPLPLSLYRFLSNGTTDTSFGTGGLVTASVDTTGINVGDADATGVAVALP